MCAKPDKNWQPGLLKGDKLRAWAHATAETATTMTLLGPRTAETAVALTREITDGAQQAMDAGPHQDERACHEGCPGCCHSLISITPPDALTLADWLRDEMPEEKVGVIRQQAEENAVKSHEMDNEQYAASMIWCPLLDSNLSCAVYPVRPICCRAWNSLSLEACHICYFSNHASKTIPLDDHAYEIGQGTRSGFAEAIGAAGLDGDSYELNSVLVTALDRPDAAECWARGEEVFEQCHKV